MIYITDIASWPDDGNDHSDHSDREDAIAFALECTEGFHTHSNGMEHITIELTPDEQDELAGFIRMYYEHD